MSTLLSKLPTSIRTKIWNSRHPTSHMMDNGPSKFEQQIFICMYYVRILDITHMCIAYVTLAYTVHTYTYYTHVYRESLRASNSHDERLSTLMYVYV